MSELLVNTIKKADGTGSLSVPAESGTVVTTASPSLGRRNLVLNGSMAVAQRGTSATGVTSSQYLVDRWKYETLGEETVTLTQSTDAPDGFANSFKVETTTADGTLDASDYAVCRQAIEAQNLQHLKYGTASALSLIVSFWVKSSVAGTYAVGVEHGETPSYYSDTFTIASANTWENHSVVISGNTATAINNDNGGGLILSFFLSAGSNYTTGSNDAWGAITNWAAGQSVDIISTLNATWQITGVQLEVGSVASSYEHRSYGEELAACQRYYQEIGEIYMSGYAPTGEFIGASSSLLTEMRATPTMTVPSTSPSNSNTGSITADTTSNAGFRYYGAISSTGRGYFNWVGGNPIKFDAEL